MDKISDARQEFSYSAQRLVISWILTFLALHYFGCIIGSPSASNTFPKVAFCSCTMQRQYMEW